MKFFRVFFFLFVLFAKNKDCNAQSFAIEKQLDSLKKQLSKTHDDTARILLKYKIGNNRIFRPGYWDSLISDAQAHGALRLEGLAWSAKGYGLWQKEQSEHALVCYNKAFALLKAYGAKSDLLPLYHYLSRYYYRKNDLAKAMEYCFTGLKWAEELNEKGWVGNFSNYASSYYLMIGETLKAMKLDRTRFKSSLETHDTIGIIGSLLNLGTDFHSMGRDDSASVYYLRLKNYLSSTFQDYLLLIEVYNSIGAGYMTQHQPDSAYSYSSKAYQLALDTHNKVFIRSAMSTLAGILFNTGRINEARKMAEEALYMPNTEQLALENIGLSGLLKMIYLHDKDYKKALEVYELNVNTRNSLTSESNRKQGLEKEFKYNLEKKENENRLLELKLRQDRYILIGLIGLLSLIAAATFLFFRQNNLRREQERTKLEHKLLQLQMNPHFIFNSLQAIQNFVLRNDRENAESYLSSFASVMRNVLESSRLEVIPLGKEIRLLEDYLRLQRFRFNNSFDYEISVGEDLDTESTMVPPMLTQPFIENAIEHGFHEIELGGKVQVSYSLKKNGLLIEITDNGSGIKEEALPKTHHSLAVEITKERIALMNQKARKKAFFSVGEAYPGNKERKGVKVIFILPLFV